jgi:hypothetical protein
MQPIKNKSINSQERPEILGQKRAIGACVLAPPPRQFCQKKVYLKHMNQL